MPDALAGATSSSTAAGSPGTMVGVGHGVLTPPMRSLKPRPFKYVPHEDNEIEEPSGSLTQSLNTEPDGALQTSAGPNAMPSPIVNFDGVNNLCGCYPPDTEGDVGPNHYMQWVNIHYAIYHQDRWGTGPRPAAGKHAVHGYRRFAGPTTTATRSCSTTSPPDAGWRLSSPSTARRQGPFYQCIAISHDERSDRDVVRVRVHRPPDEVQRLPEVRRLAGRRIRTR